MTGQVTVVPRYAFEPGCAADQYCKAEIRKALQQSKSGRGITTKMEQDSALIMELLVKLGEARKEIDRLKKRGVTSQG